VSCRRYSGISTVIRSKTLQFLLFVEDRIIFATDEEGVTCIMQELTKEYNKLSDASKTQLL
jgi:hypothetical protein